MTTVAPSTATRRLATPAFIHAERCWPQVDKLSPCEAACPLHMDVPNYIMAIAQGNTARALAIMRESNPLPSICGRVCHHPCEEECNRKLVDDPVAIEWLKRYAADWGNSEKPSPIKKKARRERVAIVGSGPAGLTAAHDLIRKGYGVTIFEAAATPGGILSSAIPDFILPLEAVQADIGYIEALGVRLHTNVRIGKDISLAGLRNQGFKAILLATGAQKSAELPIPGTNLAGIFYALPFLKAVKRDEQPPLSGTVWVIGGGAVAMDVARTALRLGAKEVHAACLESREDMPAYRWEIEAAEREGVKVHPSLAPQEFVSRSGRRVNGINFKRVTSTYLDSDGRIHWTLMAGPGSDFAVDTDYIVIAIGQATDMSGLQDESLEISKTGQVAVDRNTGQTNVRGIFAAGDVSGTGRTVTESMAAGRRAAISIDQYLSGKPIAALNGTKETIRIKAEDVPSYFPRRERWDMPRLLPKEATRTFKEVDLGYARWQAVEEARRCLNCRMCANCIFERGQLCFETADRLL
jgi:NADPH-dependent glutamate synthase beta subunit-like oxidoreductase